MSGRPPLYARLLRLRYVRPGGLLCFLFFEGAVALGMLLALAELAPWWSALVLPAAVAAMVKINDTVAGGNARAHPIPAHTRPSTGRHVVATPRATRPGARRAQVPRARPADPQPPPGRVRVRGRARAPGTLSPTELPRFGPGSGFLGALPPATAAIYRHASGVLRAMRWPSETGRAGGLRGMTETRWSAETRWTSGPRWSSEYGPADERRHGPNQGRFDQPN